MIIEGVALGAMTLAAFGVSYGRLPKGVKVFMCKHPLLTDVVIAVFFYKIMGMTIIAHVACAVMALGTQAFLHIERNKGDYQFLYDLAARGQAMMGDALTKLRDIAKGLNDQHMASQKEPAQLTSVA